MAAALRRGGLTALRARRVRSGRRHRGVAHTFVRAGPAPRRRGCGDRARGGHGRRGSPSPRRNGAFASTSGAALWSPTRHRASGSGARAPDSASTRGPRRSGGLSVSLTQSWGAAPSGGMDALLDRETLAGFAAYDTGSGFEASSRLTGELGYGLPAFGGGFTGTPQHRLRALVERRARLAPGLAPHPGEAGRLGLRGHARRDPARERRCGRRGRGSAEESLPLVGAGVGGGAAPARSGCQDRPGRPR